jgi:2-keto-3-deoxy-L-rhamnonate aldolase RhmA
VSRDPELFLFTARPEVARAASAAGIDALIVDWEHRGKRRRQAGADTEITRDTAEDLQRVRAATDAHLICRIDAYGWQTSEEVERAIACGADELLLPMVRRTADVESVLEIVDGRCPTGILVETVEAVQHAKELAALRISRAYVGLNDLAIDRGTPSIFTAVADGTVERVRSAFSVPFGFAGLTLPDRGRPIPCRLLLADMARLGSDFAFLRRSYRADVDQVSGHGRAVAAIGSAFRAARLRHADAVRRDREALLASIDDLEAGQRGLSTGVRRLR